MANEGRYMGPRRLATRLPRNESTNSNSFLYTPEANPYPSSQPHSQELPSSSVTKPKRAQVKAACVVCQRGKAKCDGARPSCNRCAKRDHVCEYDVEPDTSRLISNRRKNESLKNELNQLRSLLDCIRNRSEVESMEIYRRVRAAVDPMDVVEQLRGSESLASRLSDLELSALEHSSIKVHAEPWTRVAGDGLVSELITSFFAHDNGFYLAFIDQKCFLDDMQAGDVGNSEFCSSLLVNAICALRCSTSERARVYGSVQGFDIRERFLDEARQLLDNDYGRRCLTTVQALLVLYTCYTGQGRDRGGLKYRHAAYDMLKPLQVKLEARFRNPGIADEAGKAKYQKAVSRVLWGIYCFESISASAYLQPSLIRAPTIPRRFVDNGSTDPAVIDHQAPVPESQLSAYVLSATCDLSEKLYVAMLEYGRIGIDIRIKLYQDLRQRVSNAPSLIQAEVNFCSETSLLSTYEDMVALNLFRPLDPSQRLPDGLGTSGLLCLHHCKRILETSERYWEAWPADDYSIMSLYPLYHVAITLLHMLHNDQSHDLFERACALLARFASDFPLARYILQALKSVVVSMRLPLPSSLASFFHDLRLSAAELADVPAAFVLPARAEMWDMMYEEGQRSEKNGLHHMSIEIGELLSQWVESEL